MMAIHPQVDASIQSPESKAQNPKPRRGRERGPPLPPPLSWGMSRYSTPFGTSSGGQSLGSGLTNNRAIHTLSTKEPSSKTICFLILICVRVSVGSAAGAAHRSYDAAHLWHTVHPYHRRDPQPTARCPVRMDRCMVDLAITPPPTPSPRIEKFIDIWVSNGTLDCRTKTRGSVLRCTRPMSVSHAPHRGFQRFCRGFSRFDSGILRF